jgi:serine/threonine-protein kinase
MHGDVKLGDFGIAYAELRQSMPQAAVSEHAKGKLGYLAPEQVTGLDCDRRADVFSAAVIGAELLMGRPLFAGGSELAILLAIRDAQVHPFLEMADTLPEGLADILAKALQRKPEDRYDTAGELSELLAAYEDGPESALRRELAEIVSSAMQLVEAEAHVEATPLLPEDQLDVGVPGGVPRDLILPTGELTPVTDVQEQPDLAPPRSTAPGAPPPNPVPPQEGTYRIQTTGGMRFGPWSYAQLVEALALGKVGPEDRVRREDGGSDRIQDIASLRRHLAPHNLTPATREQEPPQAAADNLPLVGGGIITALAWAAMQRQTGLWLCELGGVRKEVYLAKGTPQFVTSNLAGELLGEYLVATGVITRGELDMALAILPRFEGRLGDTLAALGLVEPVHLFQHIAGQVQEKLLDLFLWTGGHATFYDGVEPPPSAFPLDLDPWKIIDEGIHRRIAQGMEDERFAGREETPIVKVSPVPERFAVQALPRDIRMILRALETPMTVERLSYGFPDIERGTDTKVKRALVLLFHLRAVAFAS